MEFLKNFTEGEITRLCKDDKNYDIFMSPYCHGDETNQRKFS